MCKVPAERRGVQMPQKHKIVFAVSREIRNLEIQLFYLQSEQIKGSIKKNGCRNNLSSSGPA